MNIIRTTLLAICGFTLAVVCSIITMTKGWGVEPKSWGWIIGVGFFGQLLAQLVINAAKGDDK